MRRWSARRILGRLRTEIFSIRVQAQRRLIFLVPTKKIPGLLVFPEKEGGRGAGCSVTMWDEVVWESGRRKCLRGFEIGRRETLAVDFIADHFIGVVSDWFDGKRVSHPEVAPSAPCKNAQKYLRFRAGQCRRSSSGKRAETELILRQAQDDRFGMRRFNGKMLWRCDSVHGRVSRCR